MGAGAKGREGELEGQECRVTPCLTLCNSVVRMKRSILFFLSESVILKILHSL